MHPEFENISRYFEEGRRLWDSDPDTVVSCGFFESWQLTTRPESFVITEESFELTNQTFETGADEACIAYFTWNTIEECAMMVVEGPTFDKSLLLQFNEGEPEILEQPLFFLEDEELTLGERLEIMYEVVAHVRQTEPTRDVRTLNRTEIATILDAVADTYEPRAIRIMKRLKLASVRHMLEQVVADMAVDELSNQLELPLAGSYATSTANEPETDDIFDEGPSPAIEIPARTPWNILS
ncbi:MAG: hypothetical protein ACKJSG_11375, partial [Lentisphaeria bacterium]